MADIASDFKNDAAADGGFDLAMYEVSSPITARGSYVRLDIGTSTTLVPAATANPLPVGGTLLASIDTKLPALGQALAAASVPVVLTAAQVTTLTPPAAITGFLTEATFDTKAGSLTETAPATDTASSGLNGRLQRLAQLITSLIALLPTSIGQKAKAASLAVTLASDQDALPITDNSSSLTVDNDGTFAVQVDGAALTALQLIDDAVYADGTGTPSKGVAVMGTDGTNPQIISVSAAGLVNIADGGGSITVDGTVAVSGTVTTSGTVTEANSAAIAASLSVIDDWDESDRAKVNLIAGQAGITAGAGAVAASTSRVTLASDDPAVAQLDYLSNLSPGTQSFPKSEDTASANSDTGVPAMAVRKATPANTSGTDGDYEMLQMSAGRLWVDPSGVTLTVASHAVTNAGEFAVQVDGAALTALQLIDDAVSGTGFNVSQLNGVNVTMGNGVSGTGVQRVTLANDSTGVLATVTNVATIGTSVTPGTGATNLGKAEDAAHTSGDVGVMALAVRRDTPTALGADNDYIPPTTNATGHLWVQNGPVTSGGLTMHKTISAASTNATSVKASAGMLYGLQVFNVNAAVRYLKLYNKASAPTVGTDVPVKVIAIPGGTTGGGDILGQPMGLEFATGIAFALTTGLADADTGAVAATELVVNLDYK